MRIKNLFLSPDGTDGNNAPVDAPIDAPAEVTPKYVDEGKFTEFSSRTEQTLQEIRDSLAQRREDSPERRPAADAGPKEPKAKDYKFDQPGEVERWHRDNAKYDWAVLKAEDKANESKTKSEADSRLSDVKAGNAHRAREREYTKANPTYQADIRAAHIETYDEVKKVLRDSEYSPHLFHHIAKNPDVIDKINELGEMQGINAVIRYVGRLEAMFENQDEIAGRKAEAAGDKPIRHVRNNGPFETKSGILSDDRAKRIAAYKAA